MAFYPQALSLPQLPHNSPGLETGVVNSGVLATQCIDNANGSLANYNPVQIWSCNGNPQQNWVFQPNGTVTTAPSSSNCLDVYHSGTANGTLVELHACSTSGSMQWVVLPNGSLMNPESGKCLDDPGSSTTNGTQLQIYACNGSNAQTWASPVRRAEVPSVGTIVSVASGQCVNNAHGTTTSTGTLANGNVIQVYTCSGFLSEQWTFQANGTITVAGWCIDNTSSGTTDGNPIQLHTCNGTSAQQWAHPDTGALYNPASGKCLQASTTLGVQLQLYTCSQNANQAWVYSSTYNH